MSATNQIHEDLQPCLCIDDAVSTLFNEAIRLRKVFYNSRFISVGNSPAYLIYCLNYLNGINKDESNFLPSSSFVSCLTSDNQLLWKFAVLNDNNGSELSKVQIENFRALLKKKNLSPAAIIKQYKEKKRKTTFVDYCESGQGLMSPIIMIIEWAKEENTLEQVLQAINCIAYKSSYKRNFPTKKITLSYKGTKLKIPLNSYQNSAERIIREYFCMDKINNINVRLVPSYKPEDWKSEAPKMIDNDTVKYIKNKFDKLIMKEQNKYHSERLESYKEARNKGKDYKFNFFSTNTGFSKQQKIQAVDALISAFNGSTYQEFTKLTPVLRNGELGNLIRTELKRGNLDYLFQNSKKPRTIKELIILLSEKSPANNNNNSIAK